jgi:SH3 domain
LSITRELREEDMMVSICSVVSDNEDTLNLVEGEKVYVMERYNADWWFIRKQLTNEKGWTESHNLMDTVSYTHYVQKKLNERIDKLPVFESKFRGDNVNVVSQFNVCFKTFRTWTQRQVIRSSLC